MRLLYYTFFLIFFILSGVLVFGNTNYSGEFFFMRPFEGQSLALPFFGFFLLGAFSGIFFFLSIRSLFSQKEHSIEPPQA
ncbi:hypothetical protein IPN35_05865 [Candidatus Peregrinibacteria bacterium]|nr:MAG: hypothetical protein IPN35_05865 [Candidatus Peregrinibacteria bacterium]